MAKSAAQRAKEAAAKAERDARMSAGIAKIRSQRTVTGAPPSTENLGAPTGIKGNTSTAPSTGAAPQPFDPEFEASKLGATWNVGLSDAEAGYQKGNLAYDTGYGADGLRNTANPYSQAQLLEDNYTRSLMGATNSYADMGQLYGGASGRAKGREDRLYSQGSNALQLDAQRGYHGIGVGQLQTYAGNSLGVSGGGYDALKKAIYGG